MSYGGDSLLEEDRMGMRLTTGSVTLKKDLQNLIGISIGGGAPYCPCLYIVQIFEKTPAAKAGVLQAGDEITGVNGINVKGRSKVEVARIIQSHKNEVTIQYNKLHADSSQGKSLDIILKNLKHRLVEGMKSTTADSLGLSRAILVNDGLAKRMNELNNLASMFVGLMELTKRLLRSIFQLCSVHRALGEVFASIGVKEPHARASEAFTQFANGHRCMEKFAIESLRKMNVMVSDMQTFVTKVIPDTRITVKKYLNSKFEYLSYCLKVKEMDDEEFAFSAIHEPLYRVETGNYEYRLILRCRQEARLEFAKMRANVMVKIELLDNKHVQDVVKHLKHLVLALSEYHTKCYSVMRGTKLFPIEMDLSKDIFTYDTAREFDDGLDDEIGAEEVRTASINKLGGTEKAHEDADDLLLLNMDEERNRPTESDVSLLTDLFDSAIHESKPVSPKNVSSTQDDVSLLTEHEYSNTDTFASKPLW